MNVLISRGNIEGEKTQIPVSFFVLLWRREICPIDIELTTHVGFIIGLNEGAQPRILYLSLYQIVAKTFKKFSW